MSDEIIKKMFEDPKSKPIFVIGQTVRVISKIDVNMPPELDHWLNAKCVVIGIKPRGFIYREWCYELRHPNGRKCEFKSEELDHRYKRRSEKLS